jgi:hypothetical protein
MNQASSDKKNHEKLFCACQEALSACEKRDPCRAGSILEDALYRDVAYQREASAREQQNHEVMEPGVLPTPPFARRPEVDQSSFPEWISCCHALPPQMGMYLASGIEWEIPLMLLYMPTLKEWHSADDSVVKEVTHWMFSPKTPKRNSKVIPGILSVISFWQQCRDNPRFGEDEAKEVFVEAVAEWMYGILGWPCDVFSSTMRRHALKVGPIRNSMDFYSDVRSRMSLCTTEGRFDIKMFVDGLLSEGDPK